MLSWTLGVRVCLDKADLVCTITGQESHLPTEAHATLHHTATVVDPDPAKALGPKIVEAAGLWNIIRLQSHFLSDEQKVT